jgi:alcohol dehydrogenase class IV
MHEPQNRDARESMMLAATQAGIAFSNSSVALVHGMSRPIGAKFHVPHGMSNAMLLPSVTEFSVPGAAERYAECAKAMGLVSPAAPTSEAGERLVAGLKELNKTLQVPTPEAYGIAREDWEESVSTMVEQAIASGSPANNPLIPSAEEIEELYLNLWPGEAPSLNPTDYLSTI